MRAHFNQVWVMVWIIWPSQSLFNHYPQGTQIFLSSQEEMGKELFLSFLPEMMTCVILTYTTAVYRSLYIRSVTFRNYEESLQWSLPSTLTFIASLPKLWQERLKSLSKIHNPVLPKSHLPSSFLKTLVKSCAPPPVSCFCTLKDVAI